MQPPSAVILPPPAPGTAVAVASRAVSPAAPLPAAVTRRPGAFVWPVLDWVLMGGGSIGLYLALRLHPAWATSARLVSFGAAMVWAVNYPHFASTSARLYGRRTSLAQYPMTAVVVPVLVIAVIAGSFASPSVVAPAFVMLYQLWSPYHFSGQTIGITMLYGRRHGFVIDGWLRRAWSTFVLSTFVLQTTRFEAGIRDGAFFGVAYPSLGIPMWTTDVAAVACWCAMAGLLALLTHRCVTRRRLVPMLVLLPAAAQWVWFATLPIVTYAYLVPFFHSLQYLVVAWNMELKERLDGGGHRPSPRFVLTTTVRWLVIVVGGGFAMFWLLPRVGAHFGRSLAFSTAVVLAGLQLHHFFVDGVIWRLHHPSVHDPLSSSVPEMLGRHGAAAGVVE